MYRDYFDRLFEYFSQSNNCLRMEMLEANDLEQLGYWLSKVLEEHKDIFMPFLTKYKYDQVSELFEKLNKARPRARKRNLARSTALS